MLNGHFSIFSQILSNRSRGLHLLLEQLNRGETLNRSFIDQSGVIEVNIGGAYKVQNADEGTQPGGLGKCPCCPELQNTGQTGIPRTVLIV